MITSALLGLALIAPTEDTPIEPVESGAILLLEVTEEGQALCASVQEISIMVGEVAITLGDPAAAEVLMEMAVSYFAYNFEEGFGPDAAMTQEAEEEFHEWATGCSV